MKTHVAELVGQCLDDAEIGRRLKRVVEHNDRTLRNTVNRWWLCSYELLQVSCVGCRVVVHFPIASDARNVWGVARYLAKRHGAECPYAQLDRLIADSETDLSVRVGEYVAAKGWAPR